jgi:hypothetical protein
MTDKEKKPPVWAYADEWDSYTDVEKVARLSFLAGIGEALDGRVPTGYDLPPQVGDVIQYASQGWQVGVVEAIDGDRMLIWRATTGPAGQSTGWKPIANALKVYSRRGVERRRTG